METIKGFARRATQTLKEKVGNGGLATRDDALCEVYENVFKYRDAGEVICAKVLRIAELIEELGKATKDIGDSYMRLPGLQQESTQLAADVFDIGSKLVFTAQEHQKGLKEQAFDVLTLFLKETKLLKVLEKCRSDSQLEYGFFYEKVLKLRQNPPKDFTRIIRNEDRMENWRVKLWEHTENEKALCSKLYTEGQRAIDYSVLSLTKVLGSFLDIAGDGFKQQFVNAHLPVYPTEPILPPSPLPPNPLPPYQPPQPIAMPPGTYPSVLGGQQQSQAWQQNPQYMQVGQWQASQWGQPPVWQQQQQQISPQQVRQQISPQQQQQQISPQQVRQQISPQQQQQQISPQQQQEQISPQQQQEQNFFLQRQKLDLGTEVQPPAPNHSF